MEPLESQIISHGQLDNIDELKSIVKNIDTHSIYAQIDKLLSLQKFAAFLEYLLEGCNVDEDWAYVKKTKIIVHCLKQIQQRQQTKQTLQDEQSKQVMYRIFICIQDTKFVPEHLVRICNLLMESVQKGNSIDTSWKDLIPAVMNKILAYEQVEYQDEMITTESYNLEMVQRLLGLQWSKDIVILVAEMFLNIPIPSTETNKVMLKLTGAFDILEPDEIPPLVHHLLRLSNCDGHTLFLQLAKYYGGKVYHSTTYVGSECSESIVSGSHCSPMKNVIESESNTLYHVFNAFYEKSVQQYFTFLTNLTKLPESILHPFNLTLLISASVQMESENSLQVIKSTIQRYYVEEEKRKGSCYFRETSTQRCQLRDVISQIIEISIDHRENVLDGLVKLAFVFLTHTPQIGKENIAEKLGLLGTHILISIIEKKVDIIPRAILWIKEALKTRQNSIQIIDCFATIATKFTYATIQSISHVMEIFNDFTLITNYEANAFLEVVMRLVRYCPKIKERVMVMLQDSLRSNTLETRINVVTAYLKLLKYLHIKHSSSLSQSSTSSQFSISTQITFSRTFTGTKCVFTNEAICMEAIDNLTRCFSLQVEIKHQLYKGLPDVISKNKELGMPILIFLWNALDEIKEYEDQLPPISFKNICKIRDTETVLDEPIGHMIMTIALVLANLTQIELANGVDTEGLSDYKNTFKDLADKMGQCELEQLIQNQDLDLTDNSPESHEEILTLHECIATYEAFMTYYILIWTNVSEVANLIKSLFKGLKRLQSHLKNYQRNKKVDKKNTTASRSQVATNASVSTSNVTRAIGTGVKKLKLPLTILPLHCFTRLVELLYSDHVAWSLNEEANILKVYVPFHHYVLESLIAMAQHVKQTKHFEHEKHTYYRDNFDTIAKILYARCIKLHKDLLEFDTTTAILALEAYYAIQVFKQHMRDKWEEINVPSAGDFEDVLKTYQELFDSIDADDDPDSTRIILVVVNTLSLISQDIPADNIVLFNQFLDWMKTTCLEKKITSKLAGNNFVSCLLNTSMRFQSTTLLWKVIVIALGAVVGWKTEEPPEVGDEMAMINTSTSQAILHTVLHEFKSYLDDVDWIVGRIKVEYTYAIHFRSGSIDNAHEQLKNKERNVCNKLTELVTVASLCNHLSYESTVQAQAEMMLKNNINLFNCLTSLAKYFLSTSTRDNLAFQQAHFDGLVRHVIKKLLPIIYDQIKVIEQNQQKSKQRKHTEANAFKNKVLKDIRTISNLIFAIEQFKKIVIQISKKTKVEVYGNLGIGIVRDFRIRNLKDAMAEQSSSLDDADDSVSTVADVTDATHADDAEEIIQSGGSDPSDEVSVSPAKRRRKLSK